MVKGVTTRPKGVRDISLVKSRGKIRKGRGRWIRGAEVFEEVKLTATTAKVESRLRSVLEASAETLLARLLTESYQWRHQT